MRSVKEILAPVESDLRDFKLYYEQLQDAPSCSINYVLRYLLRQGGKQLRPALVYLSARTAGQVSEMTRVAAAMVELVHNASLIHDDVVDQADLRRGLPAVYKIWKTKAAVLAGDYILAQGLKLAVETGHYVLLEYLNHAVQEMSMGELEQLRRARKSQLDVEGYFHVIRGKTAELLSVCTATGALSAGADSSTIDLFKQFGIQIGIAFQIRDDILDFTPSSLFGKLPGNDIKEGKITLPLLYALELLETAERKEKLRVIRRAKKNVLVREKLIRWVRSTDALERAEQKVAEITEQAKHLLAPVPDSEAKQALFELADYLVARKK